MQCCGWLVQGRDQGQRHHAPRKLPSVLSHKTLARQQGDGIHSVHVKDDRRERLESSILGIEIHGRSRISCR